MSRLSNAVTKDLGVGEAVRQVFEGQTSGFNASSSQAVPGLVAVTNRAVIVAWQKMGFPPKVEIRRLLPVDVLNATEGDKSLPGLAGAMRKKNASHPLYRAFGGTESLPVLTISARSGEFMLYFRGRNRGELREALIAVKDLAQSG